MVVGVHERQLCAQIANSSTAARQQPRGAGCTKLRWGLCLPCRHVSAWVVTRSESGVASLSQALVAPRSAQALAPRLWCADGIRIPSSGSLHSCMGCQSYAMACPTALVRVGARLGDSGRKSVGRDLGSSRGAIGVALVADSHGAVDVRAASSAFGQACSHASASASETTSGASSRVGAQNSVWRLASAVMALRWVPRTPVSGSIRFVRLVIRLGTLRLELP